MTGGASVKAGTARPLLVAVISSWEDLRRAIRLRRKPDLFELRLDMLLPVLEAVESKLPQLRTPCVITARHPREGGAQDLSATERRKLLLRFLPYAGFVDVEVRSARQMQPLLEAAGDRKIVRILSVHDFLKTPSPRRLQAFADSAGSHPFDILKIATRTDTHEALDRLVQFFDANRSHMPLSVMGMGGLGRQSRILFARRGSVLNYVHLGTSPIEGQLSLAELRRRIGRQARRASDWFQILAELRPRQQA